MNVFFPLILSFFTVFCSTSGNILVGTRVEKISTLVLFISRKDLGILFVQKYNINHFAVNTILWCGAVQSFLNLLLTFYCNMYFYHCNHHCAIVFLHFCESNIFYKIHWNFISVIIWVNFQVWSRKIFLTYPSTKAL